MFYQLLHVQHSCSSTQSWGSVLSSIVETIIGQVVLALVDDDSTMGRQKNLDG